MTRIGSLCTGIGGLELGLIAAVGGSVAWHVEYDKHPSTVLEARFPGVPNYGNVKTTDWTAVEPVDLLTAGYPCQPFSGAGHRRGEDDPRHLWPDVCTAVRVLRPRRVLLENVSGHLSLGFGSVLGDLAALGYDVRWVCLRAADAGAPHNRARVFILATDARGERHGRGQNGRSLGPVDSQDAGQAWERERSRPVAGDRGVTTAADAGSGPFAGATAARDGLSVASERGDGDAWGAYGPAIRRWERILGRPAPRPTEPDRSGERLNPRFVEWMQGLPDGWVTDILDREPARKALGNCVVPQQAALAVRTLLGVEAVAA